MASESLPTRAAPVRVHIPPPQADLVVAENGKNKAEALASVAKGNETVEWACSMPQLMQGKILQVSRGIDCQDLREPLGVVASLVVSRMRSSRALVMDVKGVLFDFLFCSVVDVFGSLVARDLQSRNLPRFRERCGGGVREGGGEGVLCQRCASFHRSALLLNIAAAKHVQSFASFFARE